jgi:DNA-binding response OmpR family regulator
MHDPGRRLVLLVGIDPHGSAALIDRLRRHGCPVLYAENGAAGLLAIHRERPAIVLAAADMPIMNGYQLLLVLRADPAVRHVPVILLIAAESADAQARAALAGADFCLHRGASPGDLLLGISRLLQLARRPEAAEAEETVGATL